MEQQVDGSKEINFIKINKIISEKHRPILLTSIYDTDIIIMVVTQKQHTCIPTGLVPCCSDQTLSQSLGNSSSDAHAVQKQLNSNNLAQTPRAPIKLFSKIDIFVSWSFLSDTLGGCNS